MKTYVSQYNLRITCEMVSNVGAKIPKQAKQTYEGAPAMDPVAGRHFNNKWVQGRVTMKTQLRNIEEENNEQMNVIISLIWEVVPKEF